MFVTLAHLGNDFTLSGLPITDEEYVNQFGGRILATGHVMVPLDGVLKIAAKQFPERPIYRFALLPKFGIFRIK